MMLRLMLWRAFSFLALLPQGMTQDRKLTIRVTAAKGPANAAFAVYASTSAMKLQMAGAPTVRDTIRATAPATFTISGVPGEVVFVTANDASWLSVDVSEGWGGSMNASAARIVLSIGDGHIRLRGSRWQP